MQLPALQLLEQKLERHKRLFELRKGALEKRIEQQIQLFEQRKGALEKKLEQQFENHKRKFEQKFDPTFCRLLRARYPDATVVQGDAYALKRLLSGVLQRPAAGVVSGLPLFTKPLRMRLRLLFEAFALMAPGAPFVQFTYNAVAPIPKRLDRVSVEASERVWMNIPPARVWVYRRD